MEPIDRTKENRILRNIGLALTEGIENLDKNGYGFLYLASGFIAHYNLHGFIANYINSSGLARAILANQSNNQWRNFHKGERDYEYMMQKKRIYNKICGYARGDKRFAIPIEADCFKEPKITNYFTENEETHNEIAQAYSNHLEFGNYFNTESGINSGRVRDLVHATMAFTEQVVRGDMNENEFFGKEFEFESGNKGRVGNLLDCYRDEIWNIFNDYSERDIEIY